MKKQDIRLGLIFKDFAYWLRGASCVGLNVAGHTTAKVLNEHGARTEVFAVRHNIDVVQAIDGYNETHRSPLTHVVISAPWLTVFDLKNLLSAYPKIKFAILSHSNVGFLQADPDGVELLRKYAELTEKFSNLTLGGNCKKFVDWLKLTFYKPAVLLPNLYPVQKCTTKRWRGGLLKIGAFGVERAEKNFLTAAGAALVLHKELNVPIELNMSFGGEDQEPSRTTQAIDEMLEDLPGVTLIRHPWMYWDDFIKLIGSMDILLQPSYTESFNMITADGIFEGVPSVVSSAISWAPPSWKADSDDAVEIAEVGKRLLKDSDDIKDGFKALIKHNNEGIDYWVDYLTEKEQDRKSWLRRIWEY